MDLFPDQQIALLITFLLWRDLLNILFLDRV